MTSCAGGVAVGVDDPHVAVAAFASECEMAGLDIEPRSPGDQLLDPAGGLADDHFDDLFVAQTGPGGERVLDVVLEAVLGIGDAGDAALGVGAVRLPQAVLGDDQDGQSRVDRRGRPQSGQPAPNDQHVREMVRDAFGMEWDEVAGHEQGSGVRDRGSERGERRTAISYRTPGDQASG